MTTKTTTTKQKSNFQGVEHIQINISTVVVPCMYNSPVVHTHSTDSMYGANAKEALPLQGDPDVPDSFSRNGKTLQE